MSSTEASKRIVILADSIEENACDPDFRELIRVKARRRLQEVGSTEILSNADADEGQGRHYWLPVQQLGVINDPADLVFKILKEYDDRLLLSYEFIVG